MVNGAQPRGYAPIYFYLLNQFRKYLLKHPGELGVPVA